MPGKPNTVRRNDYKGSPRVTIISEPVKDPIVKMVTSTMVIDPVQKQYCLQHTNIYIVWGRATERTKTKDHLAPFINRGR